MGILRVHTSYSGYNVRDRPNPGPVGLTALSRGPFLVLFESINSYGYCLTVMLANLAFSHLDSPRGAGTLHGGHLKSEVALYTLARGGKVHATSRKLLLETNLTNSLILKCGNFFFFFEMRHVHCLQGSHRFYVY